MNILRAIFYNDEPRLRAGWRLAGSLFLTLIFIFAFGTLLFYFPADALSTTWGSALAVILQATAVTVAIYFSRHWFDRRSLASLGLSRDRQGLRDLLAGIGIAAAMMAVIFVVELLTGLIHFGGFGWEYYSSSTLLTDLLWATILFIVVGWYEELLFRGYWLQNLAEGMRPFLAVVLSSTAFGIFHSGNPNVSPIAITWLMVAGLFFAYAYLAKNSLWLPIGLHIGWNFFEGPVFGFPVSGANFTSSLLVQSPSGPDWITGGIFGPEAGVILIVGLFVGTGLIIQYSQGTEKLKQYTQKQNEKKAKKKS